MRNFYLGFLLTIIILVIGCDSTTNNNPSKINSTPIQNNGPKNTYQPTKQVQILLTILDNEGSQVFPDVVKMDGKPLQDSSRINTGPHRFDIEKRGYKPLTTQMVVDPDTDEVFKLYATLEPKDRIVRFNIRDKDAILMPDKVTIATEGSQIVISDGALVKPGLKKLVIQKQGYQSISEDITIKPDEAPYILQYQMTPSN